MRSREWGNPPPSSLFEEAVCGFLGGACGAFNLAALIPYFSAFSTEHILYGCGAFGIITALLMASAHKISTPLF